jgi:hypothetical protein
VSWYGRNIQGWGELECWGFSLVKQGRFPATAWTVRLWELNQCTLSILMGINAIIKIRNEIFEDLRPSKMLPRGKIYFHLQISDSRCL